MTQVSDAAQPIEVFLTKTNIEVTCRYCREDETMGSLDVDSVSMRGAQREITAWLVSQGYQSAGRWVHETSEEDAGEESSRTFKPGPAAPAHLASGPERRRVRLQQTDWDRLDW